MSLVNLPGFVVPIIPGLLPSVSAGPNNSGNTTLDAANEACIFIGRVITADGASHTIDTTGSSSLQWRANSVTFANAGTTVKVGLAAVDTSNGPPGRAVNVADVITFDVSKSLTGGGGGITANAWQTHVPDAGTKTIADGDLLAMAVQMTARGGADSVLVTHHNATNGGEPSVTDFTGGAYTSSFGTPDAIIVFSDGVLGYFFGSFVYSAFVSQAYNSGSSPKEYGSLYQLPFPITVLGLVANINAAASADFDMVLYSDPLGTPVAQKTVSFSNKTIRTGNALYMPLFGSGYAVPPNTPIVAAVKPTTANNVTISGRTFGNAAHRILDPAGTSGYGVSRSSGAFADANSSLTNYYIGLLVSAFDTGGYPASRAFLGM